CGQRPSRARGFGSTSSAAPRQTNATASENTLSACSRHSRSIPRLALRVVPIDPVNMWVLLGSERSERQLVVVFAGRHHAVRDVDRLPLVEDDEAARTDLE